MVRRPARPRTAPGGTLRTQLLAWGRHGLVRELDGYSLMAR